MLSSSQNCITWQLEDNTTSGCILVEAHLCVQYPWFPCIKASSNTCKVLTIRSVLNKTLHQNRLLSVLVADSFSNIQVKKWKNCQMEVLSPATCWSDPSVQHFHPNAHGNMLAGAQCSPVHGHSVIVRWRPNSALEWQSDFEHWMVVAAAGQSVPAAQLLFWDLHTQCSFTWEGRRRVELGWWVTFWKHRSFNTEATAETAVNLFFFSFLLLTKSKWNWSTRN